MTIKSALQITGTAAALMLWSLAPASALEQKRFEAAEFKAAQTSGKSIIVEVHAPWCPTCKAQRAVIDTLAKNPKYDAVTLFQVDFDTQEKEWQGLGVRTQSTLIAFSGATETGRLVGQTAAAPIEDLVAGTLKK